MLWMKANPLSSKVTPDTLGSIKTSPKALPLEGSSEESLRTAFQQSKDGTPSSLHIVPKMTLPNGPGMYNRLNGTYNLEIIAMNSTQLLS